MRIKMPAGCSISSDGKIDKDEKEAIHSGHFMVSNFEAEAQDDDENVLLEVPDEDDKNVTTPVTPEKKTSIKRDYNGGIKKSLTLQKAKDDIILTSESFTIDSSLSKLFKAMTIVYRQKITSPKWNRFKGLKLAWKDKIRLNNLIWRCWHIQFVIKKKMRICQFSLDVDPHNKPESIILEGKYWKRKLNAVTAEYKKWRIYYKNRINGRDGRNDDENSIYLDDSNSFTGFAGMQSLDDNDIDQCLDFSDLLFSSLIDVPESFTFPNPREIARGTGNSDLVQPGLIQLQPNIDEFMDMVEPLHDLLSNRPLPSVPEEDFFSTIETPSLATPAPADLRPPSVYFNPQTSPYTSLPSEASPTPGDSPSPQVQFNQVNQHYEMFPPTPSPPATIVRETPRIYPHPSAPASHYEHHAHVPHNAVEARKPHISPSVITQKAVTPTAVQPQDLTQHIYLATECKNQPSNSPLVIEQPVSYNSPRTFVRSHSHQELKPVLVTSPTSERQTFTKSSKSVGKRSQSSCGNPYSPSGHSKPLTPIAPAPSHPAMAPTLIASPTPRYVTQVITTGYSLNKTEDIVKCEPGSLISTSSNIAVSPTICNPMKLSVVLPSSMTTNHVPYTSTPLMSTYSTSTNNQPTFTLSAVTPSSIKSIPLSLLSSTPSNWSGCMKQSPPHIENISSQPSPPRSYRPKNDAEREQYKEHRRVSHITAEQKRRHNIRNNFDVLQSLIPSMNQSPNSKISKASMLHKGAEYIIQLKKERDALTSQTEDFKSQIAKLNNEISEYQSQLPATGAPMSHTRHNKLQHMFEQYNKDRTIENWKFWMFSLIADPLLESFNSNVSTSSTEDLCRTSMGWVDQHCTLTTLRPIVSAAMKKLSTSTNILYTPETLPKEIYMKVTKQEGNLNQNPR